MTDKKKETGLNLTKAQADVLLKAADAMVDREAQKGMKTQDTQITYSGTKIVLPDTPTPMSLDAAMETLDRRQRADQEIVQVSEVIDAFPFDGLVAFVEALRHVYGYVGTTKTPGFFGSPPTFLSVQTGPNTFEQVPWGSFEVSGIKGYLKTEITKVRGRPCFVIGGEVRQGDVAQVHRLAQVTREIVKTHSIYKGKAFQLEVIPAKSTAGAATIDVSEPPEFLNTSETQENELIFSRSLAASIEANLFTPIRYTDVVKAAGIPLKRGVLLEGPYGTGKTQTANVTAKLCEEHGWTFILIKSVAGLSAAIPFAKLYAPAVVFAEDIDRVLEGQDRNHGMDAILNTIDGIDAKGSEIMVVLTTNHVDRINKAMLRPGRLDAVLSVTAPDAIAVGKLIRLYGRDLIQDNADLTQASEVLAGTIPAIIREAVERAKLYELANRKGKALVTLTGASIHQAALSMTDHLKHLEPGTVEQSAHERLGAALADVMGSSGEDLDAAIVQVGELHEMATS